MRPQLLSPIVLLITLGLGACGLPQNAAPSATPLDVNALYTQAAATIAAEYTQTALAMPTATFTPSATLTPEPTVTLLPTATSIPATLPPPTLPLPTAVIGSTQTANGCNNANWLADVTIPAGTPMKPGDKFTKTWLLKNTGTCTWNTNFRIAFVGGDSMGADTTRIFQKIDPAYNLEISLQMTAPDAKGTVSGYWQMMSEDGKLFGPVIAVTIALPGSNPTATTAAAVSSTPSQGGCLNSQLVSDGDVVSGAKMNPGEKFTKTWEIKNTGTCEWADDFKFVFVGGELFGSDSTKIRKTVGAGGSIQISLQMTAPNEKGTYSTSWQLADNKGNLFGQVFTFLITVK